jgi:hypothetical protein
MNYLEITSKFGVIILESKITVGGGDHNLLNAKFGESLNVGLGQVVPQAFGASVAYALATAAYIVAWDTKVHVGFVHDIDRCPEYSLDAQVVCLIAAGEI